MGHNLDQLYHITVFIREENEVNQLIFFSQVKINLLNSIFEKFSGKNY